VATGRSFTSVAKVLVIGVVTAAHRLLQGLHHVRVVGVVLAAVDVLEQAALARSAIAAFPGSPRQLG
jgi:hypothetical protein